ncbi:MAG: thiamine pyrophosphate-binding protein [Myxococcales bacterium]|nr:thiamine pyrophosphate-binding protein [Myxococcales bacterium]
MISSVSPALSPAVSSAPAATVSTVLVDTLRRLGVTHAFGVMGGAIAPFFHAVAHSELITLHTRHEGGAAFAAIEASLATRRPVLVFTTAGPGLTNALTGMVAARWEGAHVIFVSAATVAANRGRVATQETTAATIGGAGLFLPGGGLHLAATIDHPAQLGPIASQLATGLARPGGFVAHLSLPIDLQAAPCAPVMHLQRAALTATCPPAAIAEHAALLADTRPVVWLGFGSRHAASAIRALVERLDARVMCSPRAKGVFPEDHPRFLGVTGIGGHARVDELLAADRPAYTLVLGTRMGESSSFWSSDLTPSQAFVHVDVEPAVFGVAYPGVRTVPVAAEIGGYVDGLLAALGPAPAAAPPVAALPPLVPRGPRAPARTSGPVRPQYLIEELQRLVIDGSDAWLMAESGNSFCWASHYLRFAEPGRFRMSPGFGSMGHATTGVVGAALARRGKAVALVGDGAMMMQNELHAAVQYRADALWIVLNDAAYLMCAQGMRVMGWEPFACELPRVDFAGLARAIGAAGERVTTELEVGPALERALAARGPFVLDVTIDPREAPPSGRRNKSLMQQGFTTSKTA